MRAWAPFDDLKDYLERWAAVRMSCEPADRPTAEDGIRLAYAAAGLAPPDRIMWCGGPVEIAKQLAAASPHDLIGANVKAEIFDNVRDKVGTLAEIFWKEVVVAALEFGRHQTIRAAVSEHNKCNAVSKAVDRTVLTAIDAHLSRLSRPSPTRNPEIARFAAPTAQIELRGDRCRARSTRFARRL